MVKTLLWDNDGVLVDTERLYFRATQQVLATVGASLTEEQYVDLFLVKGQGAWGLAEERGATAEVVEQLRQQRNTVYGEMLAREPLIIGGVPEVLEALHGAYTMGIVTSSRRDHFDTIHRSSGLLRHFDFVLTAGDYTHFKPHPEPYLRAVERSGCGKEECIVIEDSQRGLNAAVAAGLRCIVIPTDFTRGSHFDGAFQVLESITELVSALR